LGYQSFDLLIGLSIIWFIDWVINHLIYWLVDQSMIDLLVDQWLIDWDP
jgi:hypothetical protein